MKNCPLAVMVGFTLCAVVCNAADVTMPDCVGVRPGMTPSEASQSLKSYDPKLEVRSVRVQVPQLGKEPLLGALMVARMPDDPRDGGFPIETVQAALTLPPNQPVVWKVFRSLSFKPDHQPAMTALLSALSEKYGKESLTISNAFGLTRYWLRGPDGKLLEGQAAKDCSMVCRMNYEKDFDVQSLGKPEYISSFAPKSPQGLGGSELRCQAVTCVIATLSTLPDDELIKKMHVAVIDAALESRAREATAAAIESAETAAAKQRLEKAKQEELPRL